MSSMSLMSLDSKFPLMIKYVLRHLKYLLKTLIFFFFFLTLSQSFLSFKFFFGDYNNNSQLITI